MKPIIYFFGSLPGGFAAYPKDHTQAFFEAFLKRSQNTLQIVVHRSDNLLHYGYVRKISDAHHFGIGFCTDVIYNDVHHLFDVFDDVYVRMIERGDILRISPKADIEWAIKNYASESVALNEYSREIIDRLNLSPDNTRPLPPPDFSIAVSDCLETSLETSSDDDIARASERYPNLYIVKTEAEIEKVNAFIRIVKQKNEEIERLKHEMNGKKRTPSGKKRRFVRAATTCLLVLLGATITYLAIKKTNGRKSHTAHYDSRQNSSDTDTQHDYDTAATDVTAYEYSNDSTVVASSNSQTPEVSVDLQTREAASEHYVGGPEISINHIRQLHNEYEHGTNGMRIKMKANIYNLQKQSLRVSVSFFKKDNITNLTDHHNNPLIYWSDYFIPRYKNTELSCTFFVPYSALFLPSGFNDDLSFDITIYDDDYFVLSREVDHQFTIKQD